MVAALMPTAASATAVVGITAFWAAALAPGTSPAIRLVPFGDVQPDGRASVTLSNSLASGSETQTASAAGGVFITNEDPALTGMRLVLYVSQSAFSPEAAPQAAGLTFGVGITDPREFASFDSIVEGTGAFTDVFDEQRCSTAPSSGFNSAGCRTNSPPLAGFVERVAIAAPDVSTELEFYTVPAPGAVFGPFGFNASITATLVAIPEPTSAAVLGIGALGLAGARKRKRVA